MSLDSNLQSAFTAVGTALKGKIPASEKGAANGVATLDGAGKIPSAQLPSYVDDVVEYANQAAFPATGSAGILYIALDTNKQYRWGGSAYAQITSGAVDSVAGKTGIVSLVKGDVGLGNVDNTSDAAKPVSTAQQTALDLKVDKIGGKGLSTEDYTTTEKTKLSGIATGAQVNQNAFSNIVVAGQTTVAADSVTDSLTLVAGTNISITTDAGTDSITINNTSTGVTNVTTTHNASTVVVNSDTGTDGTINAATTSLAGVMTGADKTKLDGIATGANNYTLPSGASATLGGIKLASDTTQSVAANAVTATASKTYGLQVNASGQGVVNVPWTDTTYANATTSVAGLMSATDKTKLDGVGATDTDFVAVLTAAMV